MSCPPRLWEESMRRLTQKEWWLSSRSWCGGRPHSYFQSGSVGCLISQRGRRLFTVGVSAKLYSGGGEGVLHSRVQASHGSFPARFPLRKERRTLQTKIRVAAT